MAAPTKDTIYIDIDDEITTIIDKLNASNAKVVALVLPKRATVLQSIVNMKLLKRASDDSKKNVVLITTEAGLLPLAGASGMFVASTLTSKPVIPTPPDNDETEETVDEDSSDDSNKEVTVATAGAVAVGALAGLPPKDDMETVQLEDDASEAVDGAATGDAPQPDKPKKVKPDKKLSVPNFERFRLWLVIGACLLVALIIGMVYAMKVMPKAVIDIKTDASTLNAAPTLNLSTAATVVDLTTSTLPSKVVTQQKTYTQQAPATGQQNNGVKATGTVTMSACITTFSYPNSVPAGTGISVNGMTYITQAVTTFSHSGTPTGSCFSYSATSATAIVAQKAGTNYNVPSGTSFAVAGRSDVTATGSASGGTDDMVTVVSQADIDNAKAKINTTDPAVKSALQTQLSQAGYLPMPATFSSGTPTTTTSANVGDAAATVTVTEVVTYSMFGVHETDLKLVVANSIKDQFDAKKQSILDYGLATATYNLQAATDKTAQLAMQTVVTVGPRLDQAAIKQQAAGKKSGDAISSINTNPGVTSVTVKLSPFWVSSIPSDTKKITVIIEKPTKAPTTNAPANP